MDPSTYCKMTSVTHFRHHAAVYLQRRVVPIQGRWLGEAGARTDCKSMASRAGRVGMAGIAAMRQSDADVGTTVAAALLLELAGVRGVHVLATLVGAPAKSEERNPFSCRVSQRATPARGMAALARVSLGTVAPIIFRKKSNYASRAAERTFCVERSLAGARRAARDPFLRLRCARTDSPCCQPGPPDNYLVTRQVCPRTARPLRSSRF